VNIFEKISSLIPYLSCERLKWCNLLWSLLVLIALLSWKAFMLFRNKRPDGGEPCSFDSPAILDNNKARDWLEELGANKDLALIEATLDKALESKNDFLLAPEGIKALAACEVIARLQGNLNPDKNYGGYKLINEWVADCTDTPDEDLCAKAHAVIDLVFSEDSELMLMMQAPGDPEEEENEYLDEWSREVSDLKSRIIIA